MLLVNFNLANTCTPLRTIMHVIMHVALVRACMFGGINFGDLVKHSPICQIKISAKVSGYTVVENTISIEKTSQIARLCHQQMPRPQNVLSQIATKLQNSKVFSYIVYGTIQKCKVQKYFLAEINWGEPERAPH